MIIVKSELNDEVLKRLAELSKQWEGENSCFGYCANEREDIEGRELFLVYNDNEIIGYLFGICTELEETVTPLQKGTTCFEIEEIYVKKEHRSKGVGKALFEYAENYYKGSVDCITLSTATKNYKSILHFYIEVVGMTFWSAKLFKELQG